MPFTYGITQWAYLDEELMLAIQRHANIFAREPIRWEQEMEIRPGESCGEDLPYRFAEIMADVLEPYCGSRGVRIAYFVPYSFDYYLAGTYPVPLDFWRSDLRPEKPGQYMLVEALWAHDTWRGITDDAYRQRVEEHAARFDSTLENEDMDYYVIYHYLELSLHTCLGIGLDQNMPVKATTI